jgi:type I restriction enzyme R subunit
MPLSSPFPEEETVQSPLVRHAAGIGWAPVEADEALRLRAGPSGQLFHEILTAQLLKLNPKVVDSGNAGEILKRLENVKNSIEGNEEVLLWLKGQKTVFVPRQKRELNVRVIDFDRPNENVFQVTAEWAFNNGKFGNRADAVFLVNGIPVVIVETKAATRPEGIEEGIAQIRRYHRETPEMVTQPQMFNVTHMIDFFYGVTWSLERKNLFNWKDVEKGNFEAKVKGFFDRERILRLIRDYVVFYRKDDELKKIVLRQHQTRAVDKIVKRALEEEEKKTGLIWHTQGSGKTFTMIVAAEKLLQRPEFEKPTVLMLVDRNELEAQLFGNLSAYGFKDAKVAGSKRELRAILGSDHRGLVVTMIHKFDKMPKDLNTRENVFVLVDEAHRTTSGDLGNYLMGALPNATYIGFTGTPIDKTMYGRGTFKVFGKDDPKGYLDKYSIAESILDGTTLPLKYTLAPNDVRVPREKLEKEFFDLMKDESVTDIEELNKLLDRAVNLKNFLKGDDRVKKVAEFVAEHYTKNVEPMGYKAFLVGVDREACALYKETLDKLLPKDYSTVVYTPAHNDEERLTRHYLDEATEKKVRKAFINKEQKPKILIVTEKLLTGFDAPILYCMYLDKPMKDHTLLQAIARVNRPCEDGEGKKKPSGFVVDFVGIFENLEKALAFDSEEVAAVIENIDILKEKFREKVTKEARDYIKLVEVPATDKTLEKIVDYFKDKEDREDFYKFFRELEIFYEIISPDKFLRDFLDDYAKLSYLYEVVLNNYTDHVMADKELRDKTSALVRKNVVSNGLKTTLKMYEINEKTLEALKRSMQSDHSKVINLAKSLSIHINEALDAEPYLIPIGDRIKSIMEQYDSRQIETKKALEELEEIVKEVTKARKEMAEMGMNINQFTIYWTLKRNGIALERAAKLTPVVDELVANHSDWGYDSKELVNLKIGLYKALRTDVDKDRLVKVVDQIIRLERNHDGETVEGR